MTAKLGHSSAPSIRSRIWQLTILACCALGAIALVLVWSLNRSRVANGWVEHTLLVLQELGDYSERFVDAETGQRGYLLTGNEEYLAPYREAIADNEVRLQQLKALATDPGAQRDLQRLGEIFHDRAEVLRRTIQLAEAGRRDQALAIVREGTSRRLSEEFRRQRLDIAAIETRLLAQRHATADRENWNILAIVLIGGAIAVLLIVGAARRTIARIDGPLGNLLVGIAALGDGNLDRRVEVRSNDEIGKVSAAFNVMADHLLTATQARQQGEADLAKSNESLLSEIGERTAAQARLSQSMAELERSNQDLDNFAYVASHDLKAPLRGIRNLAEWIAEDVNGSAGEDTIQNLALLHNRVGRLDMLLDSLLQYSRVGRLQGQPEQVDTGRLVADIAEYLAPRTGFAVTCPSPLPILHTHKAPLEQVLRNLIGNGLKHHDLESGAVVVTSRHLGTLVEFRVEDDGPGIAPEFHGRVFQMFQTLKPRDELEGSGMGLAIVKKVVEGHGGSIRIESAPPRRGTAFVFTWATNPLTPST